MGELMGMVRTGRQTGMSVALLLCICAFGQKPTLMGVSDEVKKAAAEQSAAQQKASGEQAAAMGQVARRQRDAEAAAVERTVPGGFELITLPPRPRRGR